MIFRKLDESNKNPLNMSRVFKLNLELISKTINKPTIRISNKNNARNYNKSSEKKKTINLWRKFKQINTIHTTKNMISRAKFREY